MNIYHFDAETGQLLGHGQADADPLEPGRWLIPANATNVEPPADVPGSTRHFVAGGWEYRDIPPPPEPPAPPPPPTYRDLRARAYPPMGDQLDALYHAGLFPPEMAAQIRAVKERYPKA